MKKEDLTLGLALLTASILGYSIYTQMQINKRQALLDNQITDFTKVVAEKLNISEMPNTNIVDTGAGK